LNLLTRESLTDEEWAILRDTPYLVATAISHAEGSRVDALLERAAGAKAIANGINNDHPLIRAIAAKEEMDLVVDAMYARFAAAGGRLNRTPTEMKQLAVQAAGEAHAILAEKGNDLDFYAYRTFLAGVSRAVAEAAREGDVLGIGGTLVSDAERAVIDAVDQALHGRR
jgi:F420-0:gamma-glutamyl ligase